MTVGDWINLIIGSLNLGIIGFFTYRMTKANEILKDLQIEQKDKDQPVLSCWFRNLSDKNKELSLINLGNKDLIIPYMTIKINDKTCNWIQSISDSSFSNFDDFSLCNIALKSGKIYRFHFGSNEAGGQFGGLLILQNVKAEQINLNFHMTKYGPYHLKDEKFFHY